jgi:hypothetical protein
MPCPVCQHNQVNNIDRALLAGADLPSLSRKFGFSPEALHRHQTHLQQKMAQARRRFHDNLNQGMFCKLSQVMEMVLSVVREAMKGEDYKFFLQASREFTRITNLMQKMAAKLQLDPEFIFCLMASPQWDLQEETLLPHALQAMTANRQTLKLDLFAPCPEPEAETPFQTSAPDTRPVTPQSPETPPGDRKPATGKRPRFKREKSAKIARKFDPLHNESEEFQTVILSENNLPKKRQNLFRKLFRRWEKSGKLPGKTALTEKIVKIY